MHLLHAKRWRQPECLLVGEEDKQKGAYTCDGILFSLKKDRNPVICYNMGNKETMLSVTTRCKKTNAVCFTYLGHLKKSHSQRQKEELWLLVVEVREKQRLIVQGDGVPGLQNEKFWKSDTHKVNMPDATELYSREDPLEEEMATHSRILAWEIPWTQDPGGLPPLGSQKCRTGLATKQQHMTQQLATGLNQTQNTTSYFILFFAFKGQKLLKLNKNQH